MLAPFGNARLGAIRVPRSVPLCAGGVGTNRSRNDNALSGRVLRSVAQTVPFGHYTALKVGQEGQRIHA
jgi:hypothetical protein